MSDTEHIYTPRGNSLEARIQAYRTVYEAYLNTEASLKFLDEDGWADTLGDREAVEQAYKISVRSLKMATEAFKQDELDHARRQGLLAEDEIQEIIQSKRLRQIKGIRKENQSSDSSKHRHKH